MAFVIADRVKETSTTTGTGTFTLDGAVSGFQSFASAIGNANTTYYAIVHQSATEWETGVGTYTTSGSTLARTTIISSSNSGSAVNFSAGTKDVFCSVPATRSATNNSSLLPNTIVGQSTPGLAMQYAVVANTSTITYLASTAIQNVFTATPSYPVAANSFYIFDFCYLFNKTAGATSYGIRLGFNTTATGSTISYGGVGGYNTTSPNYFNSANTFNFVNQVSQTTTLQLIGFSSAQTNQTHGIWGSGQFSTSSTAGNFTPVVQNSLSSTAFSLLPGSYVRIAKVDEYL